LSVTVVLGLADSPATAAEGPFHASRDRTVGQPGLLGHRVGHLPGAPLDDAERGVDQLVVLHTAAESFRLDPGDNALARLKAGFALHGLDHVCIVQVAVAEVESGYGVADELALAHGPGIDVGQVGQQQREETAALAVHAAPRDGP